ncbi:sulfatase-like hydrolase/transferase [Bacteroides cellulosilyticus]|uniref:sulfatase-like hydrolase/transferase n=1 Tax=Bacteroides cellulosilyticus TaxID=246787 RepID=UPI0018AC5FAA|nr:sulfatase-like hydrolase/transferase [Bacteroides cellulosilyticus]
MNNNILAKLYSLVGTFISVNSLMAQERPNVLIIMTDEHNFRTLGCYREQLSANQAFPWGKGNVVETPHIDALAHRGALCLNCYATNPVSGPSRSSFMTGMYPQTTGVHTNNIPMKDEMVTFAETLAAQGYATGYFGKWHLDGNAKPGWTPSRKFGFADNLYMYNRGHWKKLGVEEGKPIVAGFNAQGKPAENALSNADEQSFTTDFLTDKAIDFMRREREGAFCCFLSIPDPHGPNMVRPPYDRMYTDMKFLHPHSAEANTSEMPSWAQKNKKTIIDAGNKGGMAQYFGMVKCIDDNIGKISRFLESEGLNENTIIIFTADHGDLLGEHARDNKSVPFEASAKIPYIWVYPSKIAQGSIVNTTMSNADFTPTLLGLLDIPLKQNYHGKNQSDFITGKKKSDGNIAVFKGQKWIAITDGNFKLIFSAGEKECPVLFNLKKDPDEMVNLYPSEKHRKSIKQLASALKAYCLSCDEPLWKKDKIQKEIMQAIKN